MVKDILNIDMVIARCGEIVKDGLRSNRMIGSSEYYEDEVNDGNR